MEIKKGNKYYLIDEDTKGALLQLLGLLEEKATDDLREYKEKSEEWKLAKKCGAHFLELISRLITAEGGTCLDHYPED